MNVYMKKKLLIPVLMLTPLLLMGNSPAPWQPPQEYNDFKVIDLSFGDGEYELNIENYGEKYIVLDRISVYTDDEILPNLEVYNDQCLAPGDSGVYRGGIGKDYTSEEIKEVRAYAVEVEGPASYTSIKFDKESQIESRNEKQESWYYYNIEGIKKDKEYYYYSIIDLTIEGERFVYYSIQRISDGFYFVNKSGLSENDIQIEDIYLVRGRKIDYTITNIFYGVLAALGIGGAALVAAGIAVVGIGAFTIFIVIPGIILLIIRPWKKKKPKVEEKADS